MNILLIEPFFSGSHRLWAEGYQHSSQHNVDILSLPGRHWKWRMHGAAVTLAKQFKNLPKKPDLIIVSDMLDLATFTALVRKEIDGIVLAVYFHENQITYPWSPTDNDVQLSRSNHYGFINFTTALTADLIFFNSHYHQNSFLEALPNFLGQFPDYQNKDCIHELKSKSQVLPLGLSLKRFDTFRKQSVKQQEAVLLWNHRWEYDKNPKLFFETLFRLKEEVDFKLIVLGKSYSKSPPIFKEMQSVLKDELLHIGYTDSFEAYATLLFEADILPVSSYQDFFGGSVVEAIYCNCFPILPKRLAYPEHIPTELHQEHFYEKNNEFYDQLKERINNINTIRQKKSYQNFVHQYDWSTLVKRYDEVFYGSINRN